MKKYLGILALLCGLVSFVWARDAQQQARINFLIHEVETAKGLVFIRNGSEYNGVEAAKHLRRKLDYAGERVRTAEEFVRACASESSLTHQKYTVRLVDGSTLDAANYFATKLQAFDAGKK